MANVKISALPTATSISVGDLFPVVQDGVTKQATPDRLPLGAVQAAAIAAAYLTVLVHNGTSYPPRPTGVPNGLVRYVGPVQPTTWLSSDEWINNA